MAERSLGSLAQSKSKTLRVEKKSQEDAHQAEVNRRIRNAGGVGIQIAKTFRRDLKKALEDASEYELDQQRMEFSRYPRPREFYGDEGGLAEANAAKDSILSLLQKEKLDGDVRVERLEYEDRDYHYDIVKSRWHTYTLSIIVRW